MITEEILWNYVDGTLDAATRNAIARAIEGDTQVAGLYNEVMAMHRMLRAQKAESPSAAFLAGVMQSVPLTAHSPAPKVPVMPLAISVLPLVLIMIGGSILLINSGMARPFAFQVSAAAWSSIKFYSILADVVLLLLFADKWFFPLKKEGA